MMYTITELETSPITSTIAVDFSDEDVDLQGETTVQGDEKKALSYLPTFERDLRRNYKHLFPQPEEDEFEGEGDD